ncbi:hypothetical protein CLV78_104107 [Aliiruegeria haliotis]|uniref:DUF6455 domain-containing protein n=1 Tax=Aliiruegeria haliotis TaxID=1280846 RepID=A0A2T0RQZ4_9RHOB|nr:DUF6455 family protein [Aliiruegeria haliotis]PRY23616.1 hypothetical protein CLV78_104107 [Aliiruegeria haliotis]
MGCPGDTDFHFWLTRSVGRTIGLNFSAAMDEGRLSAEEYLDLVRACSACSHVASCQHWLAGQGGPALSAQAPDFCRNGTALDALKPH